MRLSWATVSEPHGVTNLKFSILYCHIHVSPDGTSGLPLYSPLYEYLTHYLGEKLAGTRMLGRRPHDVTARRAKPYIRMFLVICAQVDDLGE